MRVGPCGAGKSTYAEKHYLPHEIISTDVLRLQIYGNLGHSPDALARVWQLTYGLIKARLNAGVLTVLDATNLDQEEIGRAHVRHTVTNAQLVLRLLLETKTAHRKCY